MKNLLSTLVFTAAATLASAQLSNPSFETGDFTGWTASDGANVFSLAEEFLTGHVPFDGGFYVALLPGGSIAQTVHLRAGDTVGAWMNGSQGGEATLDLIPNSGAAVHVPWTPVPRPGEPQFPVRWNLISYQIQQDGIYSVGASSGGTGEGGPTFFGVDLFTITPVPESATYGLFAAVSGLAAILWRRRKPSAAT